MDKVQDMDWNRCRDELCEQGFVKLPGFISSTQLAGIRTVVDQAFEGAPYGRDERTNEPRDETRLVGLGEDVDILSVFHMNNDDIRTVPSNPGLLGLLNNLLGADFYLDRAIVRRARGHAKPFYYHKDQHGDIGLTVLLNDLETESGATTVLPGRHLGTPPTLFVMKDINVAHPDEVQLTGKAGDACLFYRDIDHSRAANKTGDDNIQLIFSFINRNTFPAAHSRQEISAQSLEGLPEDLRHMMRPYDGRPAGEHSGPIEKYLYDSGYSSPGAGDFDIRNDLFRDFLYTAFFARGKPLRGDGDGSLPRYTTRLNEMPRGGILAYLGQLRWRLVIRTLSLQALRATPPGRALVVFLRRALGKSAAA